MRRETLDAIVKLRQQAITEAKKRLAASIADEGQAQARAQDADRRLFQEAEAASDVSSGDDAVEAYARWLPRGLGLASLARSAWDTATTEVTHARVTLDAARSAAEMADDALEAFRKAEQTKRLRQEQLDLDEQGLRKRESF